MLRLSITQMSVVTAIAEYRRAHPYGPSRREIAERLGLCVSNTNRYISILTERGTVVVDRLPEGQTIPRSLRLAPHVETFLEQVLEPR